MGFLSVVGCEDSDPDTVERGAFVSRRVPVFVTASVEGNLQPCACPGHPPGGRARRVASRSEVPGDPVWLDAGARWTGHADPVPWQRDTERRVAFHTAGHGGPTPDVLVVGAEDLAYGLPAIRLWAERTGTTLVSSNLLGTETSTPAFSPYVVLDRSGGRVGFVGAAVPANREDVRRAFRRAGLTSAPAVRSVQAAAAAARAEGAEVVIAAGEAGLVAARGVDFVVVRQGAPDVHAGGRALGLGRRGRHVGHVDIVLGSERPEFLVRVVPLSHDVREDPETSAVVDEVTAMRGFPDNGALLYAGTRACRKCHAAEFRHWKKTGHAKAWDRLVERRQARNLDCAPCHGTGVLWPGGARGFNQVRRFMHVGCEACHGPARVHVEQPDVPYGLRAGTPVARERCEGCHRAQNHQRPYIHAVRLPKVLGPGHGRPAGGRRSRNRRW